MIKYRFVKVKDLVAKIDWPPAGTYVVAVSGGVDSVVLLDLLAAYNLDGRYTLAVAHMDHGMRVDSATDARLVAQLADDYGLASYYSKINLGPHASEESARQVRYDFLRQTATRLEAKGIITAHHLDDRLETVVLNIVRGADRYGMAPLRTRGDLYRPLVNVHKSEIYNYALRRKLHWREDITNLDARYSRNYIRQQLNALPDSPQQTLIMAMQKLDTMNDQLDALFRGWLKKISQCRDGYLYLSAAFLQRLPAEVLKHFLYFVLREIDPSVSIKSVTIGRLAQLVSGGGTGQMVTINKYLALWREYDLVVIGNPSLHPSPPAVELNPDHTVSYGSWQICLSRQPQEGCLAVVGQALTVRAWQDGDKVYPLGMAGSKKLQDVFVDRKIAQRLRRQWPVVVNRKNQVVWVPGLVADRRFMAVKDQAGTLYLHAEVIR